MPTKFEYYETGDPNSYAYTNSVYWNGQTFTPTQAHTITSVKLKGQRESGMSGTITVSIRATDGSSLPTGADLTSGTFDVASLGVGHANRAWFEVALTSYSLSAGVKYAFVVQATGVYATGGFYLQFGTDSTYLSQSAVANDNDGFGWYEITNSDFLFSEWGDSSFTPKIFYF